MTSISSAPSPSNAINKGCLHVIVLVNLNTANTKDVQGPPETVQQNIRAKSLISNHLTNMLLIFEKKLRKYAVNSCSLFPELLDGH